MTRPATRYVVRNAAGEELVVPSLADLHALYVHGFLSDQDQVRQERSDRWEAVGRMHALHGVRELRAEDPRRVALLVGALLVTAAAVGILLAR